MLFTICSWQLQSRRSGATKIPMDLRKKVLDLNRTVLILSGLMAGIHAVLYWCSFDWKLWTVSSLIPQSFGSTLLASIAILAAIWSIEILNILSISCHYTLRQAFAMMLRRKRGQENISLVTHTTRTKIVTVERKYDVLQHSFSVTPRVQTSDLLLCCAIVLWHTVLIPAGLQIETFFRSNLLTGDISIKSENYPPEKYSFCNLMNKEDIWTKHCFPWHPSVLTFLSSARIRASSLSVLIIESQSFAVHCLWNKKEYITLQSCHVIHWSFSSCCYCWASVLYLYCYGSCTCNV